MASFPDSNRFLAQLDEHKRILYKVANAYCANRDDRNDLIQDMVVQLWRSYERYDGRTRYATWMQRIAMNVAISFYRGERRRGGETLSIEEFGLDFSAADRAFDESRDDVGTMHQLIGQLDEINRAVILLYLDGFPHDEIAQMLGITATNVATRVDRIKRKLQRDYAAT